MKKKFTLLALLVVAVMTLNFAGIAAAASSPLQEEPDYSIEQIKDAGVSYTVRGRVVAENTRSVIITDGKTNVMIYGNGIADAVSLDDYIQIAAEASIYNNIIQLNYNSESPVEIISHETTTPAETDIISLDAEIANGWKERAGLETGGLTVEDYKRYSWEATASRSGSFWVLTPNEFSVDFQIEPLYVNSGDFNLQAGVKYDVIAYFTGFNNTVSNPFAGTMLEKITPVTGQLEIHVDKEYIAVQYNPLGVQVDLGVTIVNYKESDAYTVSVSDAAIANWDSVGSKLNITSVGTITVTVTSVEDVSKSVNITVVAFSNLISIADIENPGTYQVNGTVVAKTTSSAIVADDSGGIMVYDVKQVTKLAVGDAVTVSGTISKYNGLWQFSYNPGVVVEKTGTGTVTSDILELTESVLKNWKDAEELFQDEVRLYSWTAVAGLRNGFNVYSLTYGGIAVESEVDLADIVLGSTYDLEGYFVGYNTNNDYASFIITKYTLAQDQQPYLGFNRDTINLGIGSTYTLSPFVGGGITAESVAYVVGDSTVVNLNEETKVITGLKTGTTTITATAGSITRVLTVHVSSAISQVTTSGQFYTVVGRVVAKTTQSMVVHDGKDGILVYGRNVIAGFEVNDIVQVSGTVSTYNNMLQFSNPSVIEATETVPELAPTPLTKDIADGWAAARTTPFPVSACQGYTWEATVEEDEKGFLLIDFNDSSTVIEPAYLASDITLEVGKTYTITGYFIGYSTNNSYAAIAVASAKPVTEE